MSNKTKKQLLLNLPYFIAGLVCTNLGEAWRIAEGADMSEKLLGFLSALGAAFSNPMPSLHPMDLLIGVLRSGSAACCVPERQKCQEISPWHGVWLCSLGYAERHRTV